MVRLARTELPRAAVFVLALGFLFVSSGCFHRHRQSRTVVSQASTPAPTNPPATPPTTAQPSQPRRKGARPASPPAAIIQGERGIASWYGYPYHGRKTANGETYNMYGISAAHKTLPFGTKVRVHDLDNGQQVEVSINDRGPFVEGRIIDLSYGAAKLIHLDIAGIARVRLEILGYGYEGSPVPSPGIFAVQVGAFKDSNNAERLKARIEPRYGPVIIQSFDRGDGLFHRVRVGRESTEDGGLELARQLRAADLAPQTFVVRLN